MTEIYDEIKKTIDSFNKWPEVNESLEEIMDKLDDNKIEWISSLITTIESQNTSILDHISEKKSNLRSSEKYRVEAEKLKWELKQKDLQLESQKEEIEKYKANVMVIPLLTEIHEENKAFRQQIESLKAITELAVKGLEYYANKNNYGTENLSLHGFIPIDDDGGLMARTTLEVIEQRLIHEQT